MRGKLRAYEWLDEVYDPHLEGLELQHLYRSLDFKVKPGGTPHF